MQYNLDPSFQDWDTPEAFERIKEYHKPNDLDISYRTIPGVEPDTEIEIKIYRPQIDRKLPMIMNVHGGGFVAGSYENDNNRVTYLAIHIPAVVVSLNYRLAPEHVFPAALKDCLQVWNWMFEHRHTRHRVPCVCFRACADGFCPPTGGHCAVQLPIHTIHRH